MIKIIIEIDDNQKVIVSQKDVETKPQPAAPIAERFTPKLPPPPPQKKIRKDGKPFGVTAEKICKDCGKPYHPTSNVQQRCHDCSLTIKHTKPAITITKSITDEEIERSQSKPFRSY